MISCCTNPLNCNLCVEKMCAISCDTWSQKDGCTVFKLNGENICTCVNNVEGIISDPQYPRQWHLENDNSFGNLLILYVKYNLVTQVLILVCWQHGLMELMGYFLFTTL